MAILLLIRGSRVRVPEGPPEKQAHHIGGPIHIPACFEWRGWAQISVGTIWAHFWPGRFHQHLLDATTIRNEIGLKVHGAPSHNNRLPVGPAPGKI